LPGVQGLLPDRIRRRVLSAHLAAALPLLATSLWPQAWLARLAGASLLFAWLLHGHALASALHAARRFRRAHAA
jgi:hypothetical protein